MSRIGDVQMATFLVPAHRQKLAKTSFVCGLYAIPTELQEDAGKLCSCEHAPNLSAIEEIYKVCKKNSVTIFQVRFSPKMSLVARLVQIAS